MRLIVVDANILFSFFKSGSFTRGAVKSLYLKGAKFIAPDFALEELYGLKDKICKCCKIDEFGFIASFTLLSEILHVIPRSESSAFEPRAKKLLSGHIKDMPYFALALSSDCAIWSNEKRFKEQSEVEVLTTSNIKKFFDIK